MAISIEEKAWWLWALLDDIDTMDDAAKSDDHFFRCRVRALQQRRHDIMSGEEWDLIGKRLKLPSDKLFHVVGLKGK